MRSVLVILRAACVAATVAALLAAVAGQRVTMRVVTRGGSMVVDHTGWAIQNAAGDIGRSWLWFDFSERSVGVLKSMEDVTPPKQLAGVRLFQWQAGIAGRWWLLHVSHGVILPLAAGMFGVCHGILRRLEAAQRTRSEVVVSAR